MSARLGSSEIFKILSVDTRIRIIELLKSKGPIGVKNIAKEMGITPAAVSQHLKLLRQAGLVKNERRGYWIPYSIDEKAMENCRVTLNKICQCGCHGTCRMEESSTYSLTALIKYRKELGKELKEVEKRISDIRLKEPD